MQRIVAIVGQFRPAVGGTEIQTSRVAAEWADTGHRVEIWTRRLEAAHLPREDEGAVVVYRLGWASRRTTLRVRRLEKITFCLALFRRLIRDRHNYDVVVAQQALYPAIVAALASGVTGKPFVLRVASTGVTSDFRMFGSATQLVLDLFRRRTNALVVLNRQGAQEAVSEGFAPRVVHVVPNGLQVGEQIDAAPDSEKEFQALYVGGFRPEKRVDVLVRAWSDSGLKGTLALAGEGPGQSALNALADSLGVAPLFLGHVSDTRALMRRAEIFVLSSDAEGMSNALLEAMAEGCACLATFVGGNIDCLAPEGDVPPPAGGIVRGSAGWLVNAGDEKALAEALGILGADRELRRALGLAARTRALTEYDIKKTARRYIEVFDGVSSPTRAV